MKTKLTISMIKSISLILIFCAAAIIGKAQTVNLQLQSDYTNDGTTYAPSVAFGDVNNDGRPDLVATNRRTTGGDYVGIFLNNGAGGFSSTPLEAGSNLSARVVVLADFNKDGNLDMVIGTDSLTTGLNIRLGNGSGNFATGIPTGSAIIESVSDLVAADFNGDGNLDLAMTKVGGYNTAPSNAVKVWFGNGMGGFSGFSTSALMFGGAQDIEVADFNVDGRPDIAATAPNSNVIQILLNNGAGGFNAALNTTYNGARKLVSADFNRDCIPDLAVTNNSNTIGVFLGNGTGGFGAPTVVVVNQIGQEGIAVGDFNRDKKIDIAIRNINVTGSPNFEIFPGNGAGGFGTHYELTLPVSASSANVLAVADINLDGKSDIVINRQGGFALYHGNSALFTKTENDFDGDLKSDLSVFRPSNGNWYVNRSTNGFTSQQFGLASDKLVPADYDGDGKTDIAIWREGAPFVAAFWILRSSDNTVRIDQFGQTGDDSTVVADWDGDGIADPAVYRNGISGAQSFFYYRGSINNPSGNITYLPWGTSGDSPARGDFDGDGKQDAAVFRPSNAVWYVLQSSNGQLRAQNWGLATDKRVTGDYDGDGKTDFAVFRPSNSVWYIMNSSNNAISYRQWGLSGDVLTPGDFNGDGTTETAVYRPSDQRWYVPQCANFNSVNTKFGTNGDVAVPSAFVP